MIDIHAHILPGVDDGASNWDVAMAMARQAVASGTHTIYATSHLTVDDATVALFSEREALRLEFNERLKAACLDLTVQRGAEWMIAGDLLDHIPREGLLGESRAVLFEINDYVPIAYVPDFVQGLCEKGFHPVLAHPERYREVSESTVQATLTSIVSHGAVLQVTAQSLTGGFGSTVKKTAEKIVRTFPASIVVASDGHDNDLRKPELKSAYALLDGLSSGLSGRIQSRLSSLLATAVG